MRLSNSMGSIPACAGEPPTMPSARSSTAVYPRVCGGTGLRLRSASRVRGLSPRVRGNHSMASHRGSCMWSIPACAGEPPPLAQRQPGDRVYPRVCGGTNSCHVLPTAGTGLSPRVRGNRKAVMVSAVAVRSIPACAGEPQSIIGHGGYPPVYPRVCGGTPRRP